MKIFVITALTLLFSFSALAQTQAEVIVPSTFLRKSPDPVAEKIQTLQKGDKVILIKVTDTNGWYNVSVFDGKLKGWINANTIRIPASEEEVKSHQTISAVPPKPSPAPTPISKTTPVIARTSPVKITSPIKPTPTPTPTPDEEILRVDTEEISLNVRVVNSENRSVNDLDQAQFEVYEDDVRQPITSLVTTEVPTINALVIDNSRSLRSQLGKIIEAGKILIQTNRPKDESAIVRFVSADKIEVVQDFTLNKAPLNNALDNLFVEGGQTAIIDAVYLSAKKVEQYQFSQKKEDVKLRAIILVSDGDDRSSSHREQELFKLLRESNVQIYVIGFTNDLDKTPEQNGVSRQDRAKSFLTRLAEETGGKVYFPNSIDELPKIATEISSELHTQYLISYSPTNENRDGTFRKIKVVVAEGANKEKRTAITRTGRTSAPK